MSDSDRERAKFVQEKIKHRSVDHPILVRVIGDGVVENVTIHGNESRGYDLLDTSKGNVKDLRVFDNKAYGGKNPITLGNAFGVEIAGNLFDVALPQDLVEGIKSAKTSDERESIVEKITNLVTNPELVVRLLELVSKVWGS